MPLVRRVPKRGPRVIAHKRIEYDVVNVKQLNGFDSGQTVTVETLYDSGIVKRKSARVKILGDGDLEKELTVRVHGFSNAATKKIESIGGKTELVS